MCTFKSCLLLLGLYCHPTLPKYFYLVQTHNLLSHVNPVACIRFQIVLAASQSGLSFCCICSSAFVSFALSSTMFLPCETPTCLLWSSSLLTRKSSCSKIVSYLFKGSRHSSSSLFVLLTVTSWSWSSFNHAKLQNYFIFDKCSTLSVSVCWSSRASFVASRLLINNVCPSSALWHWHQQTGNKKTFCNCPIMLFLSSCWSPRASFIASRLLIVKMGRTIILCISEDTRIDRSCWIIFWPTLDLPGTTSISSLWVLLGRRGNSMSSLY